jgi:hypothetical protein
MSKVMQTGVVSESSADALPAKSSRIWLRRQPQATDRQFRLSPAVQPFRQCQEDIRVISALHIANILQDFTDEKV